MNFYKKIFKYFSKFAYNLYVSKWLKNNAWFVKFFEKYAKIMHFCYFLKKYFVNFRKFSGDPLRCRPINVPPEPKSRRRRCPCVSTFQDASMKFRIPSPILGAPSEWTWRMSLQNKILLKLTLTSQFEVYLAMFPYYLE